MPCILVSVANHSTKGSIIGDEGYIGLYRNIYNIQKRNIWEKFAM